MSSHPHRRIFGRPALHHAQAGAERMRSGYGAGAVKCAVHQAVVALLLCGVMVGCGHGAGNEQVVAEVYGHRLMQSDMEGVVGEGVSAADSVALADQYVEQWIRQMVLLSKAEKNVKDDFSRQLNEYRNSLLVYAYEQQIVDQLLDTAVSDNEVEEYYAAHSGDFLLRSCIVKAVYVVAPRQAPATAKVRSLVGKAQFGEADVVELEQTASRNGFVGYYDASTWMPFHSLQTAVPVQTPNEELFLRQTRSVAIADDSLAYFARILDYKVTNDVSPLEVQRENIKAIILNHRRVEILSRMQADLLGEAEAGGNVKRYRKET